MDNIKIDWSKPIEAVHVDGRVKPMILSPEWAGACDFKTTESPDEYNSNSYWHKSGANGFVRSPWTIRNVAPATPTRTALEQLEKYEGLLRRLAECSASLGEPGEPVRKLVVEARAIVAELPEVADGDLLEARNVVMQVHKDRGYMNEDRAALDAGEYDNDQPVLIAVAAIKRGRALERGE